jgi:hypothetical protein
MLTSTKVRLGVPSHLAQEGVVGSGLSGAGSTSQANSAAIAADVNIFTTVSAGHGCRLPPGTSGDEVTVFNNQGTNALLLYPASGEYLNAAAANASVSIAATKAAYCRCVAPGRWFVALGD